MFTPGRGRGAKYGTDHQAERRRLAALHQPWHPCTICRRPLGPMGPQLHLDHTPDGRAYRGFAHAACNVRDGAQRGARIANGRRNRATVKKPAKVRRLTW